MWVKIQMDDPRFCTPEEWAKVLMEIVRYEHDETAELAELGDDGES